MDRSQADYNYSWVQQLGVGEFETTFQQAIRTPETRAVARGDIHVLPGENLMVRIDALVHYSHTPGDLSLIDFSFQIYDLTADSNVFSQGFDGGNGTGEPSANDFLIDGQEAALMAGHLYLFRYVLSANNGADTPMFPPTGIIDVTGSLHVSIIPEPSAIACIALLCPLLLRRNRFPR